MRSYNLSLLLTYLFCLNCALLHVLPHAIRRVSEYCDFVCGIKHLRTRHDCASDLSLAILTADTSDTVQQMYVRLVP